MHSLRLGSCKYCVMRLVQLASASLLALFLSKEAAAEPCKGPNTVPSSDMQGLATCETVVRKRPPKAANPAWQIPPAAAGSPPAQPPDTRFQALPPIRPDWVYIGTGLVDAHVGERRIYVAGGPTDRYTGVTLITPLEQSQYNPYPLGPEIGFGWKTPALAAYGITDVGVGFAIFRSSLYTTAAVLGFRVGHELADGVNAGIIIGPVFSGYSQPVAVVAELEFDLKRIALSQGWDIASFIPTGLVIKNRVMPCKAEFWAPGEGANAAFELWAGFKFSLQ